MTGTISLGWLPWNVEASHLLSFAHCEKGQTDYRKKYIKAMTIIVFLVDTSPSMMQKSYLGTSYLDYARQTVEQFLKQRQRDPSYKLDRYMLMTYDQYPMNVKSVLRFVNLNRLQTGIDNYGCGRFACYPEQVIIISVTDGLGFLSPTGVPSELKLSNSTTIGSELTVEPYRWDHRLFSIVLRFPGHYQNNGLVGGQAFIAEDYPIQTLCAAMGGRSFSLTSHKLLSFCIDSILQKIQYIGVLVRLEKHGPDPLPVSINQPISGVEVPAINGVSCQPARSDVQSSSPFPISDAWKSQMVLIIKPSKYASGNWPIPEAYWPEPTMLTLPPRQVHPTILFRFYFGKKTTQCLLAALHGEFIKHSRNRLSFRLHQDVLKPSESEPFLMPYNYPVLLPLLSEAKDPELVRSPAFRKKFDKYLSTVPRYYFSSLKKSLKRGLIEKIKHHGREKHSHQRWSMDRSLFALQAADLLIRQSKRQRAIFIHHFSLSKYNTAIVQGFEYLHC
uniref:VWFA domain-containing protein n=1 Tax=Ditylenchus dipsaci TaxID=166011 RepID=A0A915E474_9BILA